jgi:hypothetical protein
LKQATISRVVMNMRNEDTDPTERFEVSTSVQPDIKLLIHCISRKTELEEEEVLRKIIKRGYEEVTGDEI